MASETLLLVLTQVLLAAAAVATLVELKPRAERRRRRGGGEGGADAEAGEEGTTPLLSPAGWSEAASWATVLAALPVTVASLLLAYYFLVPDLTVGYVWSFTSTRYPWWYRLSGFWGGQDGSLLLWAWLTVGVLTVGEVLRRRRVGASLAAPRASTDLWPLVRLAVLLVAVVLIAMVVRLDPFAPTRDAFLAFRPHGNGISPLLLSPFMLIHPPVQFVGYALAAFPMGYAAAYVLTDREGWATEALGWTRAFWLALTAAIGLGGLWAYYVLSFGGFWAWDPVETGNLLPWIVLTLGVHALVFHRKRGQYAWVAPFALILAFLMVWFSTFVTRTGLWVSVHSFVVQSSQIQDPVLRFQTILANSPLALQTLTVLLAGVLLTGLLFLHRLYRTTPKDRLMERAFHLGYGGFVAILLIVAVTDAEAFVTGGVALGRLLWPAEPGYAMAIVAGLLAALPAAVRVALAPEGDVVEVTGVDDVVTEPNLALVSILLLFTAFSTTLVLLLIGINGTQPEVYDARAPYIALPLAAALSVLFLYRRLGKARALLAGVGSLLAGGALALVSDPPLLGAAAPVLLLAAGAGYAKVLEVLGVRGRPTDAAEWSGALLVAAGLLGVAMWVSPPSNLTLLPGLAVEPGLMLAAVGLTLSMAAVLGGVVGLRQGPRRAWWAFPAGVAALGWYVGAVLAAAAAVLAWRHLRRREAEGPAAASAAPARTPPVRPFLRTAGTWIVHLGVVLLLIGYGAATVFDTSAQWDQADPAARGIPETFAGPGGEDEYTLTVVGARGEDTLGQDFYDRLWVRVALRQGGEVVDVGEMLLYWGDATGNYVPQVYISRGLLRDVYLVPDGVHTEETGWVMANGQGTRLQTDDVDLVAVRALVLPGVNLLWAGWALMLAGMGLVVAATRRSKPKAPAAGPTTTTAAERSAGPSDASGASTEDDRAPARTAAGSEPTEPP